MNTATADNRSAASARQSAHPALRRSRRDKMLGGVASGIARYLDADVVTVRISIAGLALITGVGAVAYIAAWLAIPADGQDRSIAAAWLAGRRSRLA